MSRSTYANISLSALQHNFVAMSQLSPHSKQVVVIKADAYGNGACQVALALQTQAEMFAVAFLDEVFELREAGIKQPILILQGPHCAEECQQSDSLNVVWMLHNEQQIEWLQAAILQGICHRTAHWVKLDTGMHRLGIPAQQFQQIKAQYPRVINNQTVIATHFARADEPELPNTAQQIALFGEVLGQCDNPLSLANSAANAAWPDAKRTWNRMGIALYGSSPFEQQQHALDLQVVMRLQSSVIALRTIPQGDSVGYGGTWCAPRDSVIATVGIGYADGYPRHAPVGTPAIIAGQRAALVGRVSMDMLTFDVTDLSGVTLGSEVELWGTTLPINEVATAIGTIGYELMTRVSKRVPRRYIE